MDTVMESASESEREWLKRNLGKHAFHPMADPKEVGAHPPPIITRGEGVYVFDLDGRRMLDCQGGLWCVNAGYGRAEIIDAISRQLRDLPYYTLFPGAANAPSVHLAAKLCELTAAEKMARVLFSSGGSDANETAFKIARQYWKLVGEPERVKVISFRGGYHGVHFGTMAACGGDAWRRTYEPMMPGFINCEWPDLYRPPIEGLTPNGLVEVCARLLEREIHYQQPDTIAALIAEPIQGAGGVNVPPASWFPALRAICDRYGILMIADEVVTGLGRSGALFGSRGWGVRPDMISLAKGVTSGYFPLGATLINERIADAWKAAGPRAVVMHGYTYSGHPVGCAAGLAAIAIVERENLPQNARQVGEYLLEALTALKARHPVIGDVRGKGLMLGIELVRNPDTREPFSPADSYPTEISNLCVDAGVMLRTVGNKFVISPPLIFTRAHADEAVRVLDECLTRHPYVPKR